MIVGISGTSLGAILKAKGKSNADIGKVGLAYGLAIAIASFILTLAFGNSTVLESVLVGQWFTGIVETLGLAMTSLVSGLVLGISAGISLYVGAFIYWVADLITETW